MQITRRQLSTLLLALAAGSGAAWYWNRETASSSHLKMDLPEHARGDKPPFEVFLALSKIATCRDRLDEKVARRLYDVFMAEPWGPEHISGCYRALRKVLLSGADPCANEELLQASIIGKGETWFISHLLTTWYLGIYYHEKQPTQRICWEEALMYDSVRDVLPIWFTGSRDEDYWANDPVPQPSVESLKH